MIPQLLAGGPSDCGFSGGEVDCIPDVCQPVVWEADLLVALSFPDPNTFTVILPDDDTLSHPMAATLIPSLAFEPQLSACEGVGSCNFGARAVLPPAALTIP